MSLFERLCKTHPEAVTYLDVQYRMNADIVKLCNNLVYHGKLKTDETVAKQKLHFTGDKNYENEEVKWVKNLISTENSVVFANVDDFQTFIDKDSKIQNVLKDSLEYEKDLEISLNPSYENS